MTESSPAERIVAPSGFRATRTIPPAARGGVVLVVDDDASVAPILQPLVSLGFVVVVPDLAWRHGPAGLSDPEVIQDLVAARNLLPAGARFVVGTASGGLYARVAACAVLGLAGAVSFGGRISYAGVNARHPIQPMDLLPGLSCPLQCHFEADDPAAPAAHVDELERRLAGTSQPWQVFRYGPRSDAHAAEAETRTAWGRASSFLLHLAAERA
ncbi:MAG: dienelactone hydrolase family protein [Pseudomonadota bacterium]|nr:dienelactone hydrolase family protein [Pseudomonadota bacterium]